ncbi:MAG: universal stress protein, partial [Cyanobacteria bacterium J06642_11]
RLLVLGLVKYNWTQNGIQDTLVAASFALLLVVLAKHFPVFSGYLAIMATGFFVIELDAPLARRLREGFNTLWVVAEIVLFVLLGASIQLNVLGDTFLVGLLILAMGTLIGRSLGWYLATLGSNWTNKERLFLLSGNSAKATVQAAIGAIPLAQGVQGGEMILALAALSILVTAPLGAWAIPTFAPQLLARDAVDPTKVSVNRRIVLLAAVDTSPIAEDVLIQTANLARRCDGSVVVLHVSRVEDSQSIQKLKRLTQKHLADVRHQFIIRSGTVPIEILRIAQSSGAAEIVIGKCGNQHREHLVVGSVARTVVETSPSPVIIVDAVS